MKHSQVLNYIHDLKNPEALVEISNIATQRYKELLNQSAFSINNLDVGASVSFFLRGGEKLRGVIENRGRVNFRVKVEDGRTFRVPRGLVFGENARPKRFESSRKSDAVLKQVIEHVIEITESLLAKHKITLPVIYKPNVWATHFRPKKHIQYGELCLRKQIAESRTNDSVSSNLKRFGLLSHASSRLAMLICHETAHAVTFLKYGNRVKAHGGEYYHTLGNLVAEEYDGILKRMTKIL